MINIFIFILNSLFCSIGLIILKKSFIEKIILNHTYFDLVYNYKSLFGFLMYFSSFLLWLLLLLFFAKNVPMPQPVE